MHSAKHEAASENTTTFLPAASSEIETLAAGPCGVNINNKGKSKKMETYYSSSSSATSTHSFRRKAQAAVAIATAMALIAFYHDQQRRRDEAQSEAVKALQTTFRHLTDKPKDMQLVATASAGLIPASVVLKGRAAVLDWVHRASRGAEAWQARLKGVLQILGSPSPAPSPPPPPPTGLRTRWDWVQQYPQVLESFLTDPDTGVRRSTRERCIFARSPVGAALLLGARGTKVPKVMGVAAAAVLAAGLGATYKLTAYAEGAPYQDLGPDSGSDVRASNLQCIIPPNGVSSTMYIFFSQGTGTKATTPATHTFMLALANLTKRNVVTYDYPGYGHLFLDSRRDFAANNQVAIQAFEELMASKPDHIVLVGYSLGGCPTMHIAKQYPNAVSAIVLIDPIVSLAARVELEHKHVGKLMWDRCNTPCRLRKKTSIPTTLIHGKWFGPR